MRIKDFLRELERKSYAKDSALVMGGLLDCGVGKNNFGVSHNVVELARQYDWSQLWEVPDGLYRDLKEAICKFWSGYAEIQKQNVKIGHGSSLILERLNKIFLQPGTKVLGYAPQFSGYVRDVTMTGAQYRGVPLQAEKNFTFSTERLISEIRSDYSLVYIDNPNNPTGQLIRLDHLEAIIREAGKKDVTVCIDEAYGDYVDEKYSAINLVNKYENLVVTRTFSKGYGMGGIKVGYGIFSAELGNYYDKVDHSYPISTIGSCMAKEALKDQEFIRGLRQKVGQEKDKLIEGLREKGYFVGKTFESCPIFIMGCESKNVDLREELLSKGILTVSGSNFQNLSKDYVRVNIPSKAEDFLSRI